MWKVFFKIKYYMYEFCFFVVVYWILKIYIIKNKCNGVFKVLFYSFVFIFEGKIVNNDVFLRSFCKLVDNWFKIIL